MSLFKISILLTLLAACATSCSKEVPAEDETPGNEPSSKLSISKSFSWKMDSQISLTISLVGTGGDKLSGVLFRLYQENPFSTRIDKTTFIDTAKAKQLASGITDNEGQLVLNATLPNFVDTVWIYCPFLGIPTLHAVAVSDANLDIDLSETSTEETNQKTNEINTLELDTFNGYFRLASSWNAFGKPNNLESPRDRLDKDFLDRINASFPGGKKLPESHPQYFTPSAENHLVLEDDAEIWVTFVDEETSRYSVLAYHTYPTGTPPKSVDDLIGKTLIFPNASYDSKGLQSGDKVKLKYYNSSTKKFENTFPAGTTIGWILIASGWKNKSISDGDYTHYSSPYLNIEPDASLRKHLVLLHDQPTGRLVFSFEDTRRDDPYCDNDFKDAIFFATAAPESAVKTDNVIPTGELMDTDKDGVYDHFDEYPNDPNKAYNYYYPSQTTMNSLVFEDLFPYTGDYDFNDLVTDYRITQIRNAGNKVVELQFELLLRATGASYHNGLGFAFNVPPSAIASVSGNSLTGEMIASADNGTEMGQSKAVIIAYDNSYSILKSAGGSFINTEPTLPYVKPAPLNFSVTMSTPQKPEDLGSFPYNPFIIINQQRGVEIHLPNQPPTDLANPDLLGTGDDKSDPKNDKYYISDGLPWGLNLPISFDYPLEKKSILNAYLHFRDWAESGGTLYPDWYLPTDGYQNLNLIYQSP